MTEPQGQSPLASQLADLLSAPNRKSVNEVWQKALNRLSEGDTDGAITASRTLLEMVCKHALKQTGTTFDDTAELPKLYGQIAGKLHITAAQQTLTTLKSVFGSAHSVVRSIAELRNQVGDAHGKGEETIPVPRPQAELAVNLSGSVAKFLVETTQAYVNAAGHLDRKGRVALKFDKTLVWRLHDHARNAPVQLSNFGDKLEPALWLVADAGIYLMSNGSPPISSTGDIFPGDAGDQRLRLQALADGCDPRRDDWWPIQTRISGGDDFSRTLPVGLFDQALAEADRKVVVVVSRRVVVLSDVAFAKAQQI